MNLTMSHVPILFGGALTGAAAGYVLGVVARIFFVHVEDLPSLGVVFGALAGMAIVVCGIIVAASRNRDAEMPAQFTSVNGIGSTLYGKADQHDDGSYIATEWFTFFFVPVLPICSYRLCEEKRCVAPFSWSPMNSKVWARNGSVRKPAARSQRLKVISNPVRRGQVRRNPVF